MWAGAPRHVRVAVAFQAAVLAYGAVVHVLQLLDGWPPYPWAPGWLAVYFVSLTVLDPLAAGLLLARRAAGLYLGAAVLVTDAVANGYAAYGLGVGGPAARAAQAVISVVAVVAVVTIRLARPWTVHRGRSRSGPPSTVPPR